jgi:hypothetical protein
LTGRFRGVANSYPGRAFLRAFNPHARLLANFRDHALLVDGRFGTDLRPEARQFPRMTFVEMPPMPYEVTPAEQRSLKC